MKYNINTRKPIGGSLARGLIGLYLIPSINNHQHDEEVSWCN